MTTVRMDLFRLLGFAVILFCGFGISLAIEPDQPSSPTDLEEIIFAVREPGDDMNNFGHWYVNFGHFSEHPDQMGYGSQGRLCRLNLKTDQLTLLIDDPQGGVRDPQVHYDAEKILFSYRKGETDFYNLYEINVDGTGLTQLTDGPYDDIEPTYMPDGGIMFCSSRANRFVNCWISQVATLHRCEADGSNIRLISPNVEHDNTPWMLSDGRILYQRWEYVDRNQVNYHHLWATNPDGTAQVVFFGNQKPGGVFIDAKPIPDSEKIVMIHSPGHGRNEHVGTVSIVTPEFGPDVPEAETRISQGGSYRDPYSLSENDFLVAEGNRIVRMDGEGRTTVLYEGDQMAHEPRPLRVRTREPIIPTKIDPTSETGRLILFDVYVGRNMDGLERGDIKKLLVMESLPKPINYTGGMDPLTFGGSFTLSRVLGTVPVEEDGSAHMELPASRALFFIALDENDNCVKRMQSFTTVMPGEVATCIGCHEERTSAVPQMPAILALRKPASQPTPVPNMPDVFDYPRDIQPIWDAHCLECHDADRREGDVLLTGDQGPVYTHSYFELSRRLQMADGRNVPLSNYAPRTIGSSASPLMSKVDGSHYDVDLLPEELRKVKLWIDASAVFPGTYAGLGSGMIGGYRSYKIRTNEHVDRSDTEWPEVQAAKQVLADRCTECHTGAMRLPDSPSDTMGLNVWSITYPPGRGDYAWTPPWVPTKESSSLYSGDRAVDGVVPDLMDAAHEWASRGEQNPWIRLEWETPQDVSQVVIYDRSNATDRALGGLLKFNDGTEVQVNDIPINGQGRTVACGARDVTWCEFQVIGGQGSNVGLAEIFVLNAEGRNVASEAKVTVSSSYYGGSESSAYRENIGSNSWMEQFADSRLIYSRHILYNLSRPELSLQLMAPLSEKSGGFGACGDVFDSTDDPDYQTLLTAIRRTKARLDEVTRFNMPGFKPNPAYLYEMQRYGVMPAGYEFGDPVDVYEIDRKYWESHWWKPTNQ
jgi:hypothetical protein